MNETDAGSILRAVRDDAGLSLGALAKRIYFSKCYLSNLERGKRRVTPKVVEAYLRTFGEDMHRRQMLMTLLGGSACPGPALQRAFEWSLNQPEGRSVDEWLARTEAYGREYISSLDTVDLQNRLAADLARLQGRLDHPVLSTVAARLLTLYGLTVQSTTLPDGTADRWYWLGIRAADRSADPAVRVWARGRAALSLTYHGLDKAVAATLAQEAVALAEGPSHGRLCAELALLELEDARRTFDALGDGELSDFAFSEWRLAHVMSRLASRQGDEPLALEAQETVRCTLPASIPWPATSLELQRALLMVRCGDKAAGLDHARTVLDGLTPEQQRPAVFLLMREIEATAGDGGGTA